MLASTSLQSAYQASPEQSLPTQPSPEVSFWERVWNVVKWIFHNWRCIEARPLLNFGAVQITPEVLADRKWQCIDRSVAFIHEGVGAEARLYRAASETDRIVGRILWGHHLSDDPAYSLQMELYSGHCYGASLNVLKTIRANPHLSSEEIRRSIDPTHVALIQVLDNVRVMVHRQQQLRSQMQILAFKANDQTNVPECAKEAGIPDFLIEEWRSGILKQRYQEGRTHERKLRASLYELGNMRNITRCRLLSFVENSDEAYENARWFLADPANTEPYVVNCFPKEPEKSGHSMVVDLQQNRFFDENCGFCNYETREEMVDAFLSHIKAFYPSFMHGEWEMLAYDG